MIELPQELIEKINRFIDKLNKKLESATIVRKNNV